MKQVISDTKVPVKIWTDYVEPEAEQQLRNVASLPFIYKHVAVMPDCHAGKGSTVGTVIATKGAIIPACVGVDIGCGMSALKLPFKIDVFQDLPKLRHSIERSVPTGMNPNRTITPSAAAAFLALGDISDVAKAKVRNGVMEKSQHSIGTLGGGNHFIEICGDQNNDAWIMLHSGSRNIGKCLAEIHIDKAKNLMKEYFINVPHVDLAYLVQNTPEFKAYLHDLMWGQNFARSNREEMMDKVLREVLYHVGKLPEYNQLKDTCFRVNCHHNYTSIEYHFGSNVYVTRKGAVSAKLNEWGIIPGSMGTRSYIVQGMGNADSFHSCSHGAGRRMSRTKARETFTQEDLEKQTQGVECRKDKDIVDEIPGAYKSIDEVMANQSDLVKPIFELKQILCIKGD